MMAQLLSPLQVLSRAPFAANFLCLGDSVNLAETLRDEREYKMISIDEFRKVELRIATIKQAEAHPNADKLLVLKVDLGTEERQIVAGIKAHYTPEELVGKQVVVVANLETAKLRGLESQGMVLAASDTDRIVVLTPEKAVAPGAKVS